MLVDDAAALESELVLFLLDNHRRFEKLFPGAGGNAGAYIRRAFINHLLDHARRQEVNPRRYLYRRAADILRRSPDFFTTVSAPRGLMFSMSRENRPACPLVSEDVEEIAYPEALADIRTYEAVNREVVILSLARHFWQAVAGIWGDFAVSVALGDFIGWIALHVPIDRDKPVGVFGAASETAGTSAGDLLERIPHPEEQPERLYFDPRRVVQWAGNFAARIDGRRRTVFILRYDEGWGLDDIARQVGYRSASGVKYALEHTEQQLRDFLADLPWLSPDSRGEVNRDAFALFMEALFEKMKKERTVP